MYNIALDNVVAHDSSVGLVASGASGAIGLGLKSVDRACSGKPVTVRVNESVHLCDDESFDMATMFNDCMPPLYEDVSRRKKRVLGILTISNLQTSEIYRS